MIDPLIWMAIVTLYVLARGRPLSSSRIRGHVQVTKQLRPYS